ncbi:MAG: hypothetical protein IIA45_15820, partial [Bacteroidetes bacterium]|nr:hypothetical protein [Bacteroidota bacterium]
EEYYESIYDFEKKEIKKAKSIIARLKIDNINEDGRIKTIDNYIKNNYVIQEVEVEPDDLTYILENKVASNNGMVMLYALLLQEAGVDHEIGFTSDRFNARFDKDFMSRFFFEKYIIYFPGQLKFLIPTDQFYRYPLIPHELTFNDGLFMQPVTLGKRKTAIANIVSIPSDDVNMSYGDRFIDISFENRFKKVKVSVNQQLAGHLGVGIQPYLSFFSPDEQDDIITDLIRSIGKDAVILNYVVSNMDIDKSLIEKPFTIESELIVNSLLEKAGDNYLFNIGNVIGQQVEMYQDRERQNDVEMTYPHRYLRVINVDIPDGYVIKNLDELIIDITYPTNEEPTMSFTSNYELKDNKLTITVKEFYTESRYPVDQFEQYREVINGAADFNKIVLLIEKE